MYKILRDIGRLLLAWWRRDRIRVSPDAGRLLRLRPACRLVVRGEAAEVLERRIEGSGMSVVYDCRTVHEDAELIVRYEAKSGESQIEWRHKDRVQKLAADEIEVFAEA